MIKRLRRIQYGMTALLFMIASLAATVVFAPQTFALAGEGDEENPWQISTCADLQEMNTDSDYRSDDFVLTQNINCNGVNFSRIDFGNNQDFRGTFDGAGYTIRNVAVNNSATQRNGFFAGLRGAVVKDLTLENITVSGQSTVGALAGWAESNTYIENVNVKNGTLTAVAAEYNEYFGGLVGEMHGSEVFNVIVDVNIVAPEAYAVGGVVGNAGTSLFGQIAGLGDVEGNNEVGGLVGVLGDSDIDKSFATGNVIAHEGPGGGLVGYAGQASMIGTYARGNVTGSGYLGGHTGYAQMDTVIGWAYSTGLVTPNGESIGGGLVGHVADDSVTVQADSFWDVQTSGMETSAGEGEVGKTTAEMKDITMYGPLGWNFEDYWFQGDSVNDGYLCQIWYQVCYDAFMGNSNGGGSSNLPNNGDGNNDGVIDSEQSNVVTLLSPVSSKYVTVAVDETCTLSDVSIANASDHSVQDATYAYQSGFVNFTATGCDEDVANVKLYYHGVSSEGMLARKYNPNTSTYFTINQANITAASAPLSGTLVSYAVTDNSELDIDPTEGVIVDPVGLASVNVGAPNTGLQKQSMPLSSIVGMIGLTILAIGIAATAVFRIKAHALASSRK